MASKRVTEGVNELRKHVEVLAVLPGVAVSRGSALREGLQGSGSSCLWNAQQEAGSLVEVEWLGIECTCGGATSMPGLPALVSGAGPLVYMPSGYKLAYSVSQSPQHSPFGGLSAASIRLHRCADVPVSPLQPIVMPLQPGGASRTCCLVQMIGPTPPLDKDEILRVLQMHNACPIFRCSF